MNKYKIFALIIVLLLLLTSFGCTNKEFFAIESGTIDFAKLADIAEESDSYNGKNLTKENSKTATIKSGGYIILDLKEIKLVNTIILKERTDNVELFKFYISNDNENFEMIYEQDRIDAFRLCALKDVSFRYLRFEISKAIDDVKIEDIQICYEKKKNNDFRVNGYLTHEKKQLQNLKGNDGFTGYFDVLTDVIMIGEVSINSKLELNFTDGEAQFADDLNTLREIIGERKVNIWVCVFFRMTAPDTKADKINTELAKIINKNINTISKNISNFAVKYNLYGIDYDWEYPKKSKQWKAYDLIINNVYEMLKINNIKLSMAVPPWGVKLNKKSIENIDCVNLMCYDLFDKRRDHASIYYAGAKTLKDMNKIFPEEKVLLGVPFYGRAGKNSSYEWPNYNSFYNKETNTSSLGKFKNSATRDKLDESGNKIGEEIAHFDGYTEIKDKTAMAIALGYSGIMVFEVKCDMPYTFELSLMRGIKEIIEQRA